MGIATRNGVALSIKMILVGIIPVFGISTQFGGRTDGTGIILFWAAVLAVLQAIVIMDQAKVVAQEVFRREKLREDNSA